MNFKSLFTNNITFYGLKQYRPQNKKITTGLNVDLRRSPNIRCLATGSLCSSPRGKGRSLLDSPFTGSHYLLLEVVSVRVLFSLSDEFPSTDKNKSESTPLSSTFPPSIKHRPICLFPASTMIFRSSGSALCIVSCASFRKIEKQFIRGTALSLLYFGTLKKH